VAERTLRPRRELGQEVCFFAVGRKGRDYFRRRKMEIRRAYVDQRAMTYNLAAEIAGDVMAAYIQQEVDEVLLIYSRFINLAAQRPVQENLLPFSPQEAREGEAAAEVTVDYLYEPAPEVLLGVILPEQIRVQIYHALLENFTSEQAARMTAMDNATKNCKEMVDSLTLLFNKARQAAITKELMDIVGGAEALKK
jgi:F-type H+-transporting ATPase subunit gamma